MAKVLALWLRYAPILTRRRGEVKGKKSGDGREDAAVGKRDPIWHGRGIGSVGRSKPDLWGTTASLNMT